MKTSSWNPVFQLCQMGKRKAFHKSLQARSLEREGGREKIRNAETQKVMNLKKKENRQGQSSHRIENFCLEI